MIKILNLDRSKDLKKHELMKKLITGCLFAIAFLFSTQDITAQNTAEIDAEAVAQTEKLTKLLKLDKKNMDAIYKAYQDYGNSYAKINGNLESNQEGVEKLNKILDAKLEGILTEYEYHNYLELVRGL